MTNSAHAQILKDFILETKTLIAQMQEILDEAALDIGQAHRLQNFAQMMDRIMGGARILALDFIDQTHPIHKIADYTGICKGVGYKTAQLKLNLKFYQICVALLADATEVLQNLINEVEKQTPNLDLKTLMSSTFIDRLRWVSSKFSSEIDETSVVSVASKSQQMTQDEIDKLISKLGL